MERRVLIVGLDGATWRLLRPAMEEGYLPFLKSMTESGVAGTLRSSVPPITPVAWTEFMTGCNPGKHGVFGFASLSESGDDFELNNSDDIRTKTIWELLSERNQSVVSLNLPMTYPPFPINGALVSGLFTPNESSDFTHPQSLRSDLLEKDISPVIREVTGKLPDSSSTDEYIDTIDQVRGLVNDKFAQARLVDEKFDWDVFCLQIQETDPIQHFLMGFMEENHEWYDPELRSYLLEEFYGHIDEKLEELVSELGEDCLTLVVSDHGFQTSKRTVYLGNWLREQGFASASTTGSLFRQAVEVAISLDVFDLRRKVSWGKKIRHKKEFMTMDADSSDVICAGEGYVSAAPLYVTAAEDRREEIVNNLTTALRGYTDPMSGEQIVSDVSLKEDIYNGPCTDWAPDLIVHAAPGYNFRTTLHPESETIVDLLSATNRPGIHHPNGIVVAAGTDTASGTEVDAKLQDIAPTLLHYLDEPIPEYMDGDVRLDLFDESFRDGSEPTYVSMAQERNVTSSSWTKGQEEDVMDTLSDLGYID